MYTWRPSRWQSIRANGQYFVVLCCMLFCFTSCGAAPSGSPPTTSSSHPTSVTWQPTVSTDGNGKQQDLAQVQKVIAGMSLEQKLGQLLLVEYVGTSYQGSGLQEMVQQQFVGGFMYQESNHNFEAPYDRVSNVQALSRQVMNNARIPLIIATDQEGGVVNRLYRFHGSLPSAADMAASGNPQMAFTQGTQAATWMQELGINADLAPVVDVQTVDPPVLGTRMFGRDPKSVASYAGAFLDGLQKKTVIGCLKHFPGLGGITSDPHDGLPTLNRSKEDLNNIDLAPYKLMLQQNHPAMIMSTDVLVPAIDPDLPAELSPQAINGLLRGTLGYNGVVITDGLYMGGISAKWSLSQAAVLAILAGNDLVEGPFTVAQVASVLDSLKQAYQQGKLSMERIDQSVQRILLMKLHYGILKGQ